MSFLTDMIEWMEIIIILPDVKCAIERKYADVVMLHKDLLLAT